MFFDEERIISVREMILSKTKDDRLKALLKLLPHQKKDFVEIFKIMHGLPVTVRLLDPPLHEFLPKSEKEISEVAEVVGISVKEVKSRIDELHEQIPCLDIGVADSEFHIQKFMRCNVKQFLKRYQNSRK